ncbi:hypothetical protein [Lentzea jiangxiensis]|uniref:Hygromycin-B 7''-O-kinase n=1 Tax=Lentzea jiangxiensis TaxID=641025 RepID=A0A1H0WX75_9PSEU|nr:hypothetical protein [Lentzea jiangxiensis]SDP95242.1 hygromycin-B 7''-O-kinase [Lentzea jiangxiensis]
MGALRGKLPVPTPRLHGREPDVPDVEVAAQVGEVLRVLHGVEPPGVLGPADWAAFVGQRRAVCVERQRKRGLFDFEPAMRGAFEYEFASVGFS